jgi:hypothetical protein
VTHPSADIWRKSDRDDDGDIAVRKPLVRGAVEGAYADARDAWA